MFSMEEDDPYFAPPASIRDLTVDYEIINLSDILKKKNFETRTEEASDINVKIEPSTEFQDCSLWKDDSQLSPLSNNQLSQTSFLEKGEPTTYINQKDTSLNSKSSTYNSKNSFSENAKAEHIFKHLSTEILDTSKKSYKAFKNVNTTAPNEILSEKLNNENINDLNIEHLTNQADSNTDSLQKDHKIFYSNDDIHYKTKTPIKMKNFDNSTQNLKNDSIIISWKNIQNENNIEIINLRVPMTKSLKINTDVSDTDKESTHFDIQTNSNSSIEIHDSEKVDCNNLQSPEVNNTLKKCKNSLENFSKEDNFTKKSVKKLKLCNDNEIKNNIEIDKDSVNQCLKSWRKNYSWASLEEDSLILSCEVCSYYAPNPLHIWQIKTFSDKFQVAKYLRNHNILPKHRLLSCFSNYDVFLKVYEILKGVSKTFASKKYILYENIKSIVKSYNSSLIDELDTTVLIHTVASVISESVISNIKSRMNYGITYLCDPCRRILIVYYSDSQNYPRESLITNYMNSSISLQNFLSQNGLESANFVSSKIWSCSESLSVTSKPRRGLPIGDEFLGLMKKNPNIMAYENFVWNLSVVYNKSSYIFHSLRGHSVLKTPMWGLNELNCFIFINFRKLKNILNSIYENSTNHSVNYCKQFVLDTSSLFYTLIYATSCLIHYIGSGKYDENNKRDLVNKMEKYIKMLKSNKVFLSHNEREINVLTLYYNEVIQENYYYGLENISFFYFLFDPIRLTNLLNNNSSAIFDRIAIEKIGFLLNFIPLSGKDLSMSLTLFGVHLLKISTKRNYSLPDIIELFNRSPELRKNYPYVFQLYIALGTLPIFRTSSNKSLDSILAAKNNLENDFDSDVSNSLLTIVTEGPEIANDIHTLHKMVMCKISSL